MSGTVIAETLRRHFSHVAYVTAAIATTAISVSMAAMDGDATGILPGVSLFTIIAGCQIIGPEFSSGTLQLILSKPIHRSRYLLSRVAGVVVALWVVLALLYGGDVIARLLSGNRIQWEVGGGAAVAIAAEIVLVCSLMAFFGSFTRSYLNVAIYLGGQIALALLGSALDAMRAVERGAFAAVGAFLRAHPGASRAIRTIRENLYPNPPQIAFDRNWLLMVVGNAAVALLLACLIFRKREVPYGAD